MATHDLAMIGFGMRTDGLLKGKKGLNDLRGAAKDAEVTMRHLESTAGQTNSRFAATRQKLNPAYRAMVEYRSALREINTAAKQGAISEREASNARLIARRAAEQTIASYNRLIATTRGHTVAAQANAMALHAQAAAARRTSHMSRQLSFQLVDIGQALATAPTMGIYALQNLGFQVAQIGQLYGGAGGFTQAVKDSAVQVGAFAARFGPAAIAVGVLSLAMVGLRDEINETSGASVSLMNVVVATMQEIASSIMNTANPAIQRLAYAFRRTSEIIFDTLKVILNSISNTFQAGYEAAIATWKMLPDAMSDIGVRAAQGLIDQITRMAREAVAIWNGMMAKFDLRHLQVGNPADVIPRVTLTNDNEGAADRLLDQYDEIYERVFAQTPADDFFTRVGDRARNMADDTDEATASLNGFQSAVQSIQRSTQALWDEANFFGPEFTYDLLQHQKAQELLNAAMDAGVTITDQVRSRIQGLASEYVAATQNLDLLRAAQRSYEEVMGFARDTTRGFITDMRDGLEQGKGFWRSFGDAILNVVNKVSDRLLDQLLDAIFQVNRAGSNMFGGGSSGGGGLLGGVLGSIGSLFGGSVGAPMQLGPSFSGGGYTGNGPRTGGLDGQGGFLMMGHPREHIWDSHRGMGSMPMAANNNYGQASNSNIINFNATINGSLSRDEAEEITQAMANRLRQEFPETVVNTMTEYRKYGGAV